MKNGRDELKRLNLVLRTTRDINRLMVKEKDRHGLIEGICGILVEHRSYYNAWIALRDEAGRFDTTAEAGLGKVFSPMAERLKNGPLTRCAKQALTRSTPVLIKSPLSSCGDCPLAQNYKGRGGMTLRLEHDGKVYGLLTVSIPIELIPYPEEQELLEDVAGDIAFALHKIELDEERERMEKAIEKEREALRESEERFRTVVESSLVGISIIQDDQAVYQNAEQEKLFGPLPRLSRLKDFRGIHPDDAEKVNKMYQDLTSGDVRTLSADFRFFSTGDMGIAPKPTWVYCRGCRIRYKGKDAILVNAMDITRFKELEHLLGIQDKMASLGHVAAGIAHEIRNPLSGINIYLNTLERIYDRADSLDMVGEILEKLQSASGRIESVIKRVMDFSKPSAPNLVWKDLNEPIEEAVSLSSVTLRKRGIQLESALAQDLPPCLVDRQLIEEAVLNLIINAAEAMKNASGDKKINITSSLENDSVIVMVSDSGPGVPMQFKEAIFDPFYTTKEDSTGIGLSIARRIITDHGGSLECTESQWGGAQFTVILPLNSGADSK